MEDAKSKIDFLILGNVRKRARTQDLWINKPFTTIELKFFHEGSGTNFQSSIKGVFDYRKVLDKNNLGYLLSRLIVENVVLQL